MCLVRVGKIGINDEIVIMIILNSTVHSDNKVELKLVNNDSNQGEVRGKNKLNLW